MENSETRKQYNYSLKFWQRSDFSKSPIIIEF